MALRHRRHHRSGPAAASPLGNVRGVLFDLDHTLVNRYADWAVIALTWAQRRLAPPPRPLPPKGILPAVRRALAQPVALLNARAQRALHLSPDALRLLAALHAAGIRIGIVTNGSREKRRTIRALGLPRFVGPVVISSGRPGRKPQRRIFLWAALRLLVRPSRILFVGDQPRQDIAGARHAGMKTAWLRRGSLARLTRATPAAAHVTLRRPDELLPALRLDAPADAPRSRSR